MSETEKNPKKKKRKKKSPEDSRVAFSSARILGT